MKKRIFKRGQQGFTLVELLVAVALVGIIGSAMAGVLYSTLRNTDDVNARVQALSSIESAAHQISEDGMTAQVFTISGASNDVLTLTWPDPVVQGTSYQVVYLLSGTNLERQYTVTPPGTTVTKTLAEEISSLVFAAPSEGEPNTFRVSITSSGGGSRISEMRQYDVTRRVQQ